MKTLLRLVFFFSTLALTLSARAAGEVHGPKGQLFALVSAEVARLDKVPENEEEYVCTVSSYSNSDQKSHEETVDLPDGGGWYYFRHTTTVTTANPNNQNEKGGDWDYSVTANRGGDKITGFTIKTSAKDRALFGGRKWIGIEVKIYIRRRKHA